MSRLCVSAELLLADELKHPLIVLDLFPTILHSDTLLLRDKNMPKLLYHLKASGSYILLLFSPYDEANTRHMLKDDLWHCFEHHICSASPRELQCLGRSRHEMIFITSNFSPVYREWELPLDVPLSDELIQCFATYPSPSTSTTSYPSHSASTQVHHHEENMLHMSPLVSPIGHSVRQPRQHNDVHPNPTNSILNTMYTSHTEYALDGSPSSAAGSPNSLHPPHGASFDCGSMLSNSTTSTNPLVMHIQQPTTKAIIHRIRTQWLVQRTHILSHRKNVLMQLSNDLASTSTVDSFKSVNAALPRARRGSEHFAQSSHSHLQHNRFSPLSNSNPDLVGSLLLCPPTNDALPQSLHYTPPQIIPRLPPTTKHITLCLDLNGTLTHTLTSDAGIWLNIRPYARYFLNEIAKLKDIFEVVIFAESSRSITESVLTQLDCQGVADHVLYRSHCACVSKSLLIKELHRLRRECTIIVDDSRFSGVLNQEDALPLPCWRREDKNDKELLSILKVLQNIYTEAVSHREDHQERNSQFVQYSEITRRNIAAYMNLL